MNRDVLIKIYDRQLRQEDFFPGVERTDNGRTIRNVSTDEQFGFIAYSNLDESNVEQEIDAQVAYFTERQMRFEWKVYDHDQPSELRQRLAAHGFEIEDKEALLVLDLENAPEFYWTLDLSSVVRMINPDGLDDIIRMEEEVWGSEHNWIRDRLGRDLINQPDRLSVFTVPADGRVVSAAWIYYHPPTQFGSLWGGSTLPGYRGRGFYTSLVAARAREARQRGYRFLSIDASPMSRPILEKHGFTFLCYSTPCKWTGDGQARSTMT